MSPRAVFIGLPGAGKSTVGRAVAHALNLPFADSDSLLIQRCGRTVPEVFAQEGEQRFRAIEADVIVKALRGFGGILALGGGAILHERVQEALLGERVILIDAEDSVLAARVAHSHNVRPLLQTDPYAGIARLRAQRSAIYQRLATHVVYSSAAPAAQVAAQVVQLLAQPYTQLVVGGAADGAAPYTVHIGANLRQQIVASVVDRPAALIVHAPDPAVMAYAQRVAEAIAENGGQPYLYKLPRAEAAKDITTAQAVWDFAGARHIGRDGVLIAIGGGASTDVGGFIAATWLRGIPFVTVPSTLLAMVDAAVGGKTGINTPHGKNLVGAFYPPQAVICDFNLLDSLPPAEIRAGLGEVLKVGFIQDRTILEIVAQHGLGVLDPRPAGPLFELVKRAIAVKAAIVSADPKEAGRREILNYGHTLAHAIEQHEHYQRRHGEAVAIGCVFAAALAQALGIAPAGFTDLHRSAFAAVGLPVSYPGASRKELLELMHADKKVRGGELRFVLLRDIGQPQIVKSPPASALAQAFSAIGM